jgi:hypothetical protein
LIEKVIPDLKFSLIPEDEIKIAKNPEMYLFYWCILSKRIQLAKIFWKFGKVILFRMFTCVRLKMLIQLINLKRQNLREIMNLK